MADPALLADAAKSNLEITAVSGEELAKIAKEVIDQPPEVVERIKRFWRSKRAVGRSMLAPTFVLSRRSAVEFVCVSTYAYFYLPN